MKLISEKTWSGMFIAIMNHYPLLLKQVAELQKINSTLIDRHAGAEETMRQFLQSIEGMKFFLETSRKKK